MNKTSTFLRKYISWMSRRGAIPIRPYMGGSKRGTISRYFVNQFIELNINHVYGHILEIGRNVYKNKISEDRILSYQCMDISPFPDIDIVADVQYMKDVDSNKFDTIICTQVLEHVPNPFLAVDELFRILKPDGKLLITVPFLNNYHMEPNDYWRYTEYGLAFLLKNFSNCITNSHGSTYHHVLATLGYAASEVDLDVVERASAPKFPIIISAIAMK